MFEQELHRIGLMALDDEVANPLRRVLAEVLPLARKVSEWRLTPPPWTGGTTACLYNPTTHQPESYVITATQNNLGNVVHELTHVAVNEAYDQDFVNYSNPGARNVPMRQYLGGIVQNEEMRQLSLRDVGQDQQRLRVFDELIAMANGALAQLGHERLSLLTSGADGKFMYGKTMPHKEFDTVINQTFVWLHEWRGQNPGPAFTTLFNSLARQVDAACDLRQQARRAEPARPSSTVPPRSSPPDRGEPAATRVIPAPRT